MPQEYITLLGIGVQTALYLFAGYGMVIRADNSARNLKEEVMEMKEELKVLSQVITVQAVQTNRLDNLSALCASLEKRVEDMRRGRGFVQRESVESVDREY